MSGRRRIWLSLLPAAAVLSSCATLPVSKTYISSSSHGLSLIVPADWEVYSSDQIVPEGAAPPVYLVGFGQDVVNVTEPMLGPAPGGVMTVTLHPGLDLARSAAANALLVDLAAATAAGAATVVDQSEPRVEGDFERRRWIIELPGPQGTVTRVIQEVATSTVPVAKDEAGTDLYANKSLIVGCNVSCFSASGDVIAEIYESWEVK